MKNKREALLATKADEDLMLFADGFDAAILGLTAGGVVVYCVETCIEVLKDRDGLSHTDAVEFFEFNVRGAYVGELTPVWVDQVRTLQNC